jgi:hypothetical protein
MPSVSRVVDLNASGEAYTPIYATTFCRRIVVEESLLKADGATAVIPQGLTYQLPNDSFT